MADERKDDNTTQILVTLAVMQEGLENHFKDDIALAADVKELREWVKLLVYGDESQSKSGYAKRLDRLEQAETRRNVGLGAAWIALIGGGVKFLWDWIAGGHAK